MILDKLDTETYTRPTTRFAGAADVYIIEDALRASTAAPPPFGNFLEERSQRKLKKTC